MKGCFFSDPHFREIFNHFRDGIFIADHNGIALWINDASTKQIGASKGYVIGKSAYELEEEGLFTPSVTKAVLEKRETISRVQTSNNRQFLATGTLITVDEDYSEYVLVHVKDITETVRSSLKLEKAEAVIQYYVEEIQKMKYEQHVDDDAHPRLIGKGKVHEEVMDLVKRVAKVDATVLVLGETGVGKSVIAETIHNQSERANKKFVQINCAALPDSLIESELFGYKKGAFTGANAKGKPGLVEEANGGTLFLDEIGELPLSLQPKLLQLLQDKMYLPLGDTVPRSADVRILAATNRDLGEMVNKREFREDLYYRLNVVSIRVPPLRERREDIIPFLSHYMQHYNQKYERSATLTNEAIDTLQSYDWPGNIRELENMVERMIITSTSDVILKSALPEKILSHEPFHDPAFSIDRNQSLPLYLENIEKQAIKKALKEKGSTRKAAADLGMTQSALMRRIKKYDIHPK